MGGQTCYGDSLNGWCDNGRLRTVWETYNCATTGAAVVVTMPAGFTSQNFHLNANVSHDSATYGPDYSFASIIDGNRIAVRCPNLQNNWNYLAIGYLY